MGFIKKIGSIVVAGFYFSAIPVVAMELEPLGELTVDTAGIQTSFNHDVWGNVTSVLPLIKQIKTVGNLNLTPTERIVFSELMMTDVSESAFSKQLDQAVAEGVINRGDFLITRVEALITQGLYEEALRVLQTLSEPQMTSEIQQIQATALMGLGQKEKACSLVDGELAQLACAVENGSVDEASLAFDVYREKNKKEKESVFALAGGGKLYLNDDVKIPEEDAPSVWEVGLLARGFGTQVLEKKLSRGVMRALALNSALPNDIRLMAAEKAFLTETDWEKLLVIKVEDTDKTKSKQEKEISSAEKRLLLYQNVMKEDSSEETRQKSLVDYLTLAEKDGVLTSVAPVIIQMVQTIQPKVALMDIAPSVVRISALRGEVSTAFEWQKMIADKNPVESLKLAALINAIGGGIPETIDPLVKSCLSAGTCKEDLYSIPFYFPITIELAMQIPTGNISGYPGFVTMSVQEETKNISVGTGVLYGLQLLSGSKELERPLIQEMGKQLPQKIREALLVERLVGAGSLIKTH